jgi:hypothetical protein
MKTAKTVEVAITEPRTEEYATSLFDGSIENLNSPVSIPYVNITSKIAT